MARTLNINTISRNSAKELAPWATWIVRVAGGFIAYEDRSDVLYPTKIRIKKRECYINKFAINIEDRQRYINRMNYVENLQREKEEQEKRDIMEKREKRLTIRKKRKEGQSKWFPFKSKEAYDRVMG